MADNEQDWSNAGWEGSRKAQLRKSLALTPRERFEALEELAKTAKWLAGGTKKAAGGLSAQEKETFYHGHTNKIVLQGCRPTPLSRYLKALAILRLVAEQSDENAKGYWEHGFFVLESRLDKNELVEFFLQSYCPTPIAGPWNGGSGFYPKDNRKALDLIVQGQHPRFRGLIELISAGDRAVSLFSLKESPKDKKVKNALQCYLRGTLSDDALNWLDAAVCLSDDSKYPPLLGTGGNDGRLDFTNNFLQRLLDLFDPQSGNPLQDNLPLIHHALFNVTVNRLSSGAIGQFSPGEVGGPNATTGFEADTRLNPWDYILMLEGAMVFAAAATRRLENEQPGALSYPFTVRSVLSGSAKATAQDEANARGEIWLPIWEKKLSYQELKILYTEGRASVGRRPVIDGLDFARAVSSLAIDRGITAFQRYAFTMRSGKAYLATPLEQFPVSTEPATDWVSELERYGWLQRAQKEARKTESSGTFKMLVQRLENGLFELTKQTQTMHFQSVLQILGKIQSYLARSPGMRAKLNPVPMLSRGWVLNADDRSIEFQLACALASVYGDQSHPLPLRVHLAPVEQRSNQWLAEGQSHYWFVWNQADLSRNLIAILQNRLLCAGRDDLRDKPLNGLGLSSHTIAAWLLGQVNEQRIGDLLLGLANCRMPDKAPWANTSEDRDAPLPLAYLATKALYTPERRLHRFGLLEKSQKLPTLPEVVKLLAANDDARFHRAMAIVSRRLRITGMANLQQPPLTAGLSPQRLAAAMLLPAAQIILKCMQSTFNTQHGITAEKPYHKEIEE